MTHPRYRRPPVRRGMESYGAKLTDEAVREVRALYEAGGWTHRSLGAQYGVSHHTIGQVVRRRSWRHVQ